MKELRNIICEYDKIKNEHEMALATVVRVKGSSYRSPGARMLIRKDGRWTGSISGGCLEGDALRKARKIMASKKPMLVTYDTMDDENNSLGVGLGCNGIIDVLLEPITNDNNAVARLKNLVAIEDMTVLATVFRSEGPDVHPGDQIYLDPNFVFKGNIKDEKLVTLLKKELLEVYDKRKPTVKSLLNDSVEVFLEIIEPSIDLQIYGAGFDAKPVVEIAKTLGWQVSVYDECIAHLAPINFPEADTVSLCQRDMPENEIKIKPYSAAVLMSHSYDYDYAVLKKLINTSVKYIGILGPKKRSDKMFIQLEKDGFTNIKKDRIHSPVGLDIGAETPEEIALSIITEIQAKFSQRSGGFLKYRNKPIHQRDGKDDQVFKQVFLNPNTSIKKARS